MVKDEFRSLGPEELAQDTLRYLASQVSKRPIMRSLVMSDLNRWDELTGQEKALALARNVRRVSAVCPWVGQKGRVLDALGAFSVDHTQRARS